LSESHAKGPQNARQAGFHDFNEALSARRAVRQSSRFPDLTQISADFGFRDYRIFIG